LTAEEKQMLEELSRSRTGPVREAERAKILVAYVEHRSFAEVMRRTGVGGSTVTSVSTRRWLADWWLD